MFYSSHGCHAIIATSYYRGFYLPQSLYPIILPVNEKGDQTVKKKVIFVIAIFTFISSILTACTESAPNDSVPAPSPNVTVHPEEIDFDGHSGFALFLDDRYAIHETDSGWLEPSHFRVYYMDRYGPLVMMIDQTPDIKAQEHIDNMVTSWAENGRTLTYELPTADFPFFAMSRVLAVADTEEEDLEWQLFVRDNEQGGVFRIIILLSPDDWEEHGSHLLQSLASFEVLVD